MFDNSQINFETDPSSSSSFPLLDSEKQSEKKICRNCHDDEGDDFISPCNCSGSIRWVHRHCLDEWRSVSTNPNSFGQCDICHFNYKFKNISEDQKPYLKAKVTLLILRDFLLVAIIFQALVWACVGLVVVSSTQETRDSYFPSEWPSIRVNYVAGLLCFLFLLGIASVVYAILKFCCGCFVEPEYTYDTYPYYYGGNWFCFWNCGGYPYHHHHHHHHHNNYSTGNCGSCNCNGTGNCGSMNCGGSKDLSGIVIGFVIIGAIVAVGILIYVMVVSASHHIQKTYKRVKTGNFVVVDLSTEGGMV